MMTVGAHFANPIIIGYERVSASYDYAFTPPSGREKVSRDLTFA